MILSHALRAVQKTSDFNPFTIETENTIGTDFSPYSLGTPPDWDWAGTHSGSTIDIEDGGQYGKKLVISRPQTSVLDFAAWTSSRLSAVDDQEMLILVKVIQNGGYGFNAMAGLKVKDGTNYVQGAGLGNSTPTTTRAVRINRYTSASTGSGAPSWAVNDLYWIRIRNHTVNTNSRKVWIFGSSEPASFTNISVSSSTWTPLEGYAGLGSGVSGSSGSLDYLFETHWISVGYNFNAAPFPV